MLKMILKINLFITILVNVCFSAIHPALKEAIDSGDIKTAESLVKKIGVKDIYCPSSLSFKDGMKIYEKIFSTYPEMMWNHCDSQFVENAKPLICKTSVPLCKRLLNKENVGLWKPYLLNILEAKLYLQYEKRTVKKKELQKATKEECLVSVESEKRKASVYLEFVGNQYGCGEDNVVSTILCASAYMPVLDSFENYYAKKVKNCKKKPMKLVETSVESEVPINPFALEIEKFGNYLVKQMKKPIPFNEKDLILYKKLKDVPDADSASIKAFVKDVLDEKNFWSDNKKTNEEKKQQNNEWMEKIVMGCLAFAGVDSLLTLPFYLGGGKLNCNKIFLSDEDGKTWHSQKKNFVIKSLFSIYASKGFVPDDLVTLACRLHHNIDKDILKMTEVQLFKCSLLTENENENEIFSYDSTKEYEKVEGICKKGAPPFIWSKKSGEKYVCEDKILREATWAENKLDIPCTAKNRNADADGFVCTTQGWIDSNRK